MKKLLCLIFCLLFINCCHLYENDVIIVTKKIYRKNNKCNYILDVPVAKNIMLIKFPCDCYGVGDTIDFLNLKVK